MKILITGGSGYIGSHTILEMFEKTNFQPISIDNYSNSFSQTYQRVQEISGKKIEYLNLDLCMKDALFSFMQKHNDIQGIIHFAAFKAVNDSVNNPLVYYRNNMESLLNVLEAIQHFSIPYFVFSSSCSIYGDIEQLPVSEKTPTNPLSPYAHTKNMGEQIIRDFYKTNPSLKAVLLRYFNPVGAHISGKNGELPINKPNNIMPVICNAAAGLIPYVEVFGSDYPTRDGSCIRDYVHVSDIALAHINALDYMIKAKEENNCEYFNLGTGEGVSVLEIIHAFKEFNQVDVPYKISSRRAGDVMAIYSDSTKANKKLQWYPKYSLQDMVCSAWKWQQNINQITHDDTSLLLK